MTSMVIINWRINAYEYIEIVLTSYTRDVSWQKLFLFCITSFNSFIISNAKLTYVSNDTDFNRHKVKDNND